MIEYLATAVIQIDSTDVNHLWISDMNPAAEILFEISHKKVIGLPIQDVFMEQQAREPLNHVIARLIDANQPLTRREAVIRIGLNDKIVDYTLIPIFKKEDAKTSRIILEIQPITRLLNITREEQRNQQHQISRKLIRGVAHEIKNPLAGIRGATQLLSRELKKLSTQHQLAEDQFSEYTHIILHEVDRLKTLVDAMLGSHKALKRQSLNIHEPIEYVRLLLLSQIEPNLTQHIVIERDYDLSLPEVSVDRHQLIQVLLNIGSNAIQALQENLPAIQDRVPTLILKTRIQHMMTIQGVRHRSVIRIDFIDNGLGVPADFMDSIFYPMMTTRSNGTGLGLSIAQDIVHQHQGLISCESVAGRTMFSIFLPWKLP